jgi:hypothetical protein
MPTYTGVKVSHSTDRPCSRHLQAAIRDTSLGTLLMMAFSVHFVGACKTTLPSRLHVAYGGRNPPPPREFMRLNEPAHDTLRSLASHSPHH